MSKFTPRPTFVAALERLEKLGSAESTAFAVSYPQGPRGSRYHNVLRWLERRRLVENDGTVKYYTGEPGEVYTGPRIARYQLTDAGREYLRKARETRA